MPGKKETDLSMLLQLEIPMLDVRQPRIWLLLQTKTTHHHKFCTYQALFMQVVSASRFQLVMLICRKSAIFNAIRKLTSRKRSL